MTPGPAAQGEGAPDRIKKSGSPPELHGDFPKNVDRGELRGSTNVQRKACKANRGVANLGCELVEKEQSLSEPGMNREKGGSRTHQLRVGRSA